MVMKEGFDLARQNPRNQDPAKQLAIKQAEEMLGAAGVKDPEAKVKENPLESLRTMEEINEAKLSSGWYISQMDIDSDWDV